MPGSDARACPVSVWCPAATLLAAAGLAAALNAPAAANADAGLQTLNRGEFILSPASDPPPAAASWQSVTLPDVWKSSRPGQSGFGWYRFAWEMPVVPRQTYAIYLATTRVPTRVFVNDAYVGATGDFFGPRPRSFDQSQAFDVPAELLVRGRNVVTLQVNATGQGATALDVVLAGPEVEVRKRAMRDLFIHTVAPGIVSVATFVVGLSILLLWLRRRETAYVLFGVAAMLWGAHTAVTLLPSQPLPDPHYPVIWHAVYMLFVVLLSLFCADFVGFRSPLFRRAAIGFALAVAPILYLALPFGAFVPTAVALRASGILIVLVALAAVARYVLRHRSVESLLLLLAGAVSAAFALHDWFAAQDPDAVRPVWLVPYAAVFFLSLFGWVLIDRFVRALNEAERVNVVLEQRVQEKSAALVRQLADTEAARRQAEEAQRQAEAARVRAEAADRAKSRFLAAASHDLRQPLHALGLFAAALGQRSHEPESMAIVERIKTLAGSLGALFSSLLDVSKLEAGIVVAAPRDVALAPLLERIANDFAPEALDQGLDLLVLPTRRVVRSDPLLLERILRNLVANALKYTQRGGVLVGCRPRGGGVSIEVWDTGPGIPPAEQSRIFEEFYQIGNAERDRAKGLGLGLAIVRRLADLLGHRVELASRPGRGSVFRVQVPRASGDVADAPPGVDAPATTLTGRRILVVDDEVAVRDGMCDLLAAWGCRAEAFAGPAEVPPDTLPPDAMIVDYRLVGSVDGLAAIAELRARFGRDLPAILISGESSSAHLARIDASGIPLLHKPVPPAKLRAALQYTLARGDSKAAV
ncbi:MAG: response regulator [Betaproteobacteria bacterium]|nr:response regulator [Betaproteobacteria bacterium]